MLSSNNFSVDDKISPVFQNTKGLTITYEVNQRLFVGLNIDLTT